MNYSLYLFAQSGDAYHQYPLDSTEGFFQAIASYDNDKLPMLHVRSIGALRYYSYVRAVEAQGRDRLGICVVTNGLDFGDIRALWQAFDDLISRLLVNKLLIELSSDGRICWSSELSGISQAMYDLVESVLRQTFSGYLSSSLVHRSGNFLGVTKATRLALEQGNTAILSAVEEHSNVEIYTRFSGVSPLCIFEQTNAELRQENRKLQQEYNLLLAKKKQRSMVIVLVVACLVVVLIALGIYSAFVDAEEGRNTLMEYYIEQGDEVSRLEHVGDSLQKECDTLRLQLEQVVYERSLVEYERDSLNQQVNNLEDYIRDFQ